MTKRLFSGTDIGCYRGGRIVFQNVKFSLQAGDILHLSGANGCGKTSLLRIMAGALPQAAGDILWKDKDYLSMGMEAHAERYAYLPADNKNLKPQETVLENLSFWAKFLSAPKDHVQMALTQMNIDTLKDEYVRSLSTGQKRRLSLARVLLRDVPLWLLDEPLNALDSTAHLLFMNILSAHCKRGGMAVIASHQALTQPRYGRLHKIEVGK